MQEQYPAKLPIGSTQREVAGTRDSGKIFGLRLGKFGLFASLLIAFSSGFLAFFLATFVSIFAILIYNTAGHRAVDYAAAYKVVALPVGVSVGGLCLIFFGAVWIRRKVSGGE